ncbi:membrane associated rhomboid family serine protease [Mobilisporobacter senegalensis]|uniref:Membrane associated rhomboid family serine protease n=1 Tax=Mobilisporobacter senegalensis TaxID=1329262 RepID=A0A3N1XS28_9FIRM|nr:rhomboid family intramembrane serine protease [Mobilisporobacter senegalensis]ROR29460.1 membrane associated rhomboid family serine protease [Mobilisporobacter senegalensis]
MNFLNKLERKFGRYAIHNFIYYIIVINVGGAILTTINPSFYNTYLSLDIGKIFEGQVWRLLTFIIQPSILSGGSSILFFALEMYLYYIIGNALENAWGAFRFNLYYISGLLFNILAAVILYLFIPIPYPNGLTYIYQSMFFAFAVLYPNMQFLIFFIIPVKVKWLAYLYGAFIGYEVISSFTMGIYGVANAISILVALANFLIFFLYTRNYKKISPREMKRKATFKKEVKRASSITRHKCAVCGKTELDDENLEFRFCSKCDGNYEYCMEHLFTHEHVHHDR